MKMTLSVFILLLSINSFAQVATKVYQVEFKAYLYTDKTDIPEAINNQINHSLGPAITNKLIGQRSSLTEKFKHTILNRIDLENGLKKIDYSFNGRLVVESNVDMTNYKVTLPINTELIYSRANFRCASKSGDFYFYQSWTPTFRECLLEKGLDYEEFSLDSYTELGINSLHQATDFRINNQYQLFFYFGSDYHSTSRFGHGETAYKKSMRAYNKRGFYSSNDNDQKIDIFGKSDLHSRYQKLTGKINGIETNIHFLLGNPDDATPIAKYEFFKFFKYAFQNGSGLYYGGHAGLGKNLNFDLLEKQYDEKITYNLDQKQMMIFSGCSTYLQSSGFFFDKKPENLVLATNGLSVKLRVNKYLPLSFINLFQDSQTFSNNDVFNQIYFQFKESGAKWGYFPMTAVESN